MEIQKSNKITESDAISDNKTPTRHRNVQQSIQAQRHIQTMARILNERQSVHIQMQTATCSRAHTAEDIKKNKPLATAGFVQKSDCSFPHFSRTKLLLFPDFSRHFVHLYVNKNSTKLAFKCWNFLHNVFSYSKYRMGLNFWTLSFRCFVSWTARKLTNASVINSVIDICIFQVNITVFKDFSRLFHTYDHFQDFSKPWKFLY